jgi:hypothetical protein
MALAPSFQIPDYMMNAHQRQEERQSSVHFTFEADYRFALRPVLGGDWHAALRPRGRGPGAVLPPI